ncbi:MAG: histidinol-phosphate transaminase [Desulfovibrio sp.]|nr:histidinol-phosphate transaminase [Desulfovibrio sp.]
MYTAPVRPQIQALDPYTPGLSIDEIRQKYGLTTVYKLASNENPLGASALVQAALQRASCTVFRYPRSGNLKLRQALSEKHSIDAEHIIVGNGSDEIIDLLLRIVATPGQDNVVCFQPCFNLYTIQAQINGIAQKRLPLNSDFTFDLEGLKNLVDENTCLVFITSPDNPSGYAPKAQELLRLAESLTKYPRCLLLIDEAYMDFSGQEETYSLLAQNNLPDNVAIMRTFSKSYGLAGLRLGYAIVPKTLAEAFWRARLPFSVNILAEEAGLAALSDHTFHTLTLETVARERQRMQQTLTTLGCQVWPSLANFLLFQLPKPYKAQDCFLYLLQHGVIIRLLKSYALPDHLRVSVGNKEETTVFLQLLQTYLQGNTHA